MSRSFLAGTQRPFYPLLVALLVAGASTLACGEGQRNTPAPTAPLAQSLTRVDGGQGGVTVEATWVAAPHRQELALDSLRDYPADRYALIHLKLDTHSGDLSRYDLPRLATLTGPGPAPVAATAWLEMAEGGHHREGVLVFPGRGDEQGRPEGGRAELKLTGIAGVAERLFLWEF